METENDRNELIPLKEWTEITLLGVEPVDTIPANLHHKRRVKSAQKGQHLPIPHQTNSTFHDSKNENRNAKDVDTRWGILADENDGRNQFCQQPNQSH